ncbi:MAG TPA: 2-amino-4-hydroxy-6-hydroxymethyldihydropteridine diphosphokinase [Steroidobacteraceae bacterium]|jgi:2-amino-4-hydroxy-6-hydroxymethyldihydropteridine diphosphokinase|nr:2-amino-4-hydroxy-6-hydroxymethyldihydropteridine diphosphokinase [Steroidobacteraceae bacterium]
MTAWLPAYIGIGSNVDGPRAQVLTAFDALAQIPQTLLVARSPLYTSRPHGPVAQDDFVNAAAGLLTQLDAAQLLQQLRAIESARGRRREQRWGPRNIDLDLLVFADQRIETPELTVPHPGIVERNFVLYPLSDIAPQLQVPGVGRVADLKERVDPAGIAALA